ncbi:hypothetical protein F3J23_15300 [Chryseobacterium sp. Tr-659]|uniref:hypothetical protein n=1 Tax=Chryseobacterium sp. Tr-659 TaxID=2608340 RepID=UPI001420E441|nr:hypothetical protein [Chryseobacterium sp. Tr-659]NIF06813.1 hypothetical protein [Chryseobacterium sp. Tr-659]
MKKNLWRVVGLLFLTCSIYISAQSQSIKAEDLPEYIVLNAENTKLLGGIGLSIASKNSSYKEKLDQLEDVITNKKTGEGVRNLTDLLNVMHKYGFEYVDAFLSSSLGLSAGDDFSIGSNKSRSSIVFRKIHSPR